MAGQGTVSVKAFESVLGFEIVAAATLAAASGLAAIPQDSKIAYIQVEGGDVKYRDDGTNPTAANGMRLYDGSVLEYSGTLSALKFILASGAPKLNVTYYK